MDCLVLIENGLLLPALNLFSTHSYPFLLNFDWTFAQL